MRRLSCTLILAAAITAIACGDQLPSQPTNPGTDLTGTWRGSITVTNVSTTMTWTLTQTGSTATGPVVISLPTGVVLMNGTVTGTVSGSSFPFTLTVPPGGILTQPGCSGQITGTSTLATPMTMNGTYSVASSTCATGLTSSGTFTLNRQ
jgi:hypothetical protein